MASNSWRHRYRQHATTVDTEERRSNFVPNRFYLLSSVVESVAVRWAFHE
jgi:hypothetical protein